MPNEALDKTYLVFLRITHYTLFSFIILACAGVLGGYISKKMHAHPSDSHTITFAGSKLILASAIFFVVLTFLCAALHVSALFHIALTLTSMAGMMTGIGIMIPNLLSQALDDYRTVIGTASSLFGFYYYCLISVFTLIMGCIHNHTLFPMPIFFLCIALSIVGTCKFLPKSSQTSEN